MGEMLMNNNKISSSIKKELEAIEDGEKEHKLAVKSRLKRMRKHKRKNIDSMLKLFESITVWTKCQ